MGGRLDALLMWRPHSYSDGKPRVYLDPYPLKHPRRVPEMVLLTVLQ